MGVCENPETAPVEITRQVDIVHEAYHIFSWHCADLSAVPRVQAVVAEKIVVPIGDVHPFKILPRYGIHQNRIGAVANPLIHSHRFCRVSRERPLLVGQHTVVDIHPVVADFYRIPWRGNHPFDQTPRRVCGIAKDYYIAQLWRLVSENPLVGQ